MKRLHLFLQLFVFILIAEACTPTSQKSIVNEEEINQFLTEKKFIQSSGLNAVQDDLSFWKDRLNNDPGSATNRMKLAAAYSARFSIKKDFQDLHKADSLYQLVYMQQHQPTSEQLQAMAQISITKHRFQDALDYSLKALEIGDEKETSLALLFDSMMEVGDYTLAKQNLDRLKNSYSFGYMMRKSKYSDYEGKLDSAIYYMEQAADLVDHNISLSAWSKSNLGDMYGHSNRVEKSYNTYMKVLKAADSGASYIHAMKGIGWIAFSHDGNTELAKKILRFIDEQTESPDVYLTLAEIAEHEGNMDKKSEYQQQFKQEAGRSVYFGMYDVYLIELAAEAENFVRALALVDKELKNRPSPPVYDLKAWVYYQKGDTQRALEIIQGWVEEQTEEPMPAYHRAKIYQANGMEDEAMQIYQELLESSFELGPKLTKDIKNQAKTIS